MCSESRRRLQGSPKAAAGTEDATGACGTAHTGQHLRVGAERWPDGTPAPMRRGHASAPLRIARATGSYRGARERARDGHL